MAIETADDFVDKKTHVGRLFWLGLALFRAGVAVLVAVVFVTGLAALELRHKAEQALAQEAQRARESGQEVSASQPELRRLIAEGPSPSGAPTAADLAQAELRVQTAAALAQAGLRPQADAAYDAKVLLEGAVLHERAQQVRLEQAHRRLLSAAELAECGVNPTIATAQACAGAGTAPSVIANLNDAKTAYNGALDSSVAAGVQVRAMQVALDAALRPADGQVTAGASLAPAVPALREFDEMQSYLLAPVRPPVATLFGMSTDVGILLMAFVAGLLGSTCLLFILITFPNYLPLTFGSGQHFFLRMFTGGAVAVLVVLLMRLGSLAGAPQELATAQAMLQQANLSEPVRYALIGVVAGFLAEQIAKWAKDYAEAAFHGVRTGSAPPPAADAAGDGRVYSNPPEGGPRPAI